MMTMMNMNMDYETYKAWVELSNHLWDKIAAYFKENSSTILEALASAAGTSYVPSYVR